MFSNLRHRWWVIVTVVLTGTASLPSQEITWVQTDGPYGGAIRVLVELADNTILGGAAAPDGGLFRSFDNGETWHRLRGSGIPPGPYYAFLSFPGREILTTAGDGVYRSRDAGNSWQKLLAADSTAEPLALGVSLDGVLFAAGGSRVWRSADSGATWQAFTAGLETAEVHTLAILADGTLFAGGNGVYRSEDRGETWTRTRTWPANPGINVLALNREGQLLAGTDGGLFKTVDNGDKWENLGLVFDRIFSIHTRPAGMMLAGTECGVLRSTDNGTSWNAADSGLTRGAVLAFANGTGNRLLAGHVGDGVFFSDNDGTIWHQSNSGMIGSRVNALAIPATGSVYAACTNGVFLYTPADETWAPLNTGLADRVVLSLIADSSGALYAGSMEGGVFRLAANAASWENRLDGARAGAISALAIDMQQRIYAGGSRGVFRSDDYGITWAPENNGLTDPRISALASLRNGPLFAGTETAGLFRSDDGAASWQPIGAGVLAEAIRALAAQGESMLLAGTAAGAFFSSDTGHTWLRIDNLPSGTVHTVAFHHAGEAFAAIGGALYYAKNARAPWQLSTSGLFGTPVVSIASRGDGTLFLGTAGSGVFRSAGPVSAVAARDAAGAATTIRLRSHPNPFNAGTWIEFTLARAAAVQLVIYALDGRLVYAWPRALRTAGSHRLWWSGKGSAGQHLASGIYYLRLRADRSIAQHKLLLLR